MPPELVRFIRWLDSEVAPLPAPPRLAELHIASRELSSKLSDTGHDPATKGVLVTENVAVGGTWVFVFVRVKVGDCEFVRVTDGVNVGEITDVLVYVGDLELVRVTDGVNVGEITEVLVYVGDLECVVVIVGVIEGDPPNEHGSLPVSESTVDESVYSVTSTPFSYKA